MLCCAFKPKLIAEDKRMRYSGFEYLKSMSQLFRDHLADEVITEAHPPR